MLVRIGLLAGLVAAAHAALSVKDGKLSIVDSVGAAAVASTSFSSSSPSPLAPYSLSPTDNLKLAFTLVDDSTDSPVLPHQAAVLFEPSSSSGVKGQYGRDYTAFLKINKRTGKAKYELDLARAPAALLTLPSPLSLSLLLAAPGSDPLRLPLGEVSLPEALALPYPFPPNEDLPRSWEVETYAKQPELSWTFRTGEKKVGFLKAAVGTAVVASPWAVFAGSLLPLLPSLSLRTPSPRSTLFLTLVITLESAFALYWLNLTGNLLQTLPIFAALALGGAVVGRGALGEMRRRRLAGGKKSE
ncbi:hypothetical protein JCM8547_004182 [Rhodosporidiobolus lusitaniae]